MSAAVSPVLQALYEGRREDAEELARNHTLDAFEAAALGRTERLAELLDADPKAARAAGRDGFTALHLAAFFGHPEAVRLLLERGADVDAVAANAMAVHPLHAGAASARADVVALLLGAGADPNSTQQLGFTALHEAALNGRLEMVDALVAAGADPGQPDAEGRTAADHAERGGHDELARRLR